MSAFVRRSIADIAALFASATRIFVRGWWLALATMSVFGGVALALGAAAGALVGLVLGVGSREFAAIFAIGGAAIASPAVSAGALAAFHLAARSEDASLARAIGVARRGFPYVFVTWILMSGASIIVAGFAAMAIRAFVVFPRGGDVVIASSFLLIALVLYVFFIAPMIVLAPTLGVVEAAAPDSPRPGRFFELARRNVVMNAVAATMPVAALVAAHPSAIGLAVAGHVVGSMAARVATTTVGLAAFVYVHALFAAAAIDVVARERGDLSSSASSS